MFADFKDLIALLNNTWYTMGVPPIAIDILPEIPGVAFSAAWKNRVTLVIDDASGLAAHFISRDDLIAAKLAAGRPRDLADVEEMRKATAKVPGRKKQVRGHVSPTSGRKFSNVNSW